MATAAPEVPALARDRAFETLYRRYAKDVYRYALAVLRNPADAEDVTQTTFMNAYRVIQRGEKIEKPHNWLIKIAHNAARTRYARASRRVREVPLDDHVEQLAVAEEERADVHAVLDALGSLPLNQRAALVMRELEGRSYAEIADTLGVSVAAVETLIFRGRRSLRVQASAVRVLGAVQLPASLSQLVGAGGGVVAGGGTIVGGGFLLKAAVAIVAGVVATGMEGDHSRPATAAARQDSASVQAVSKSSSERGAEHALDGGRRSVRVAGRSGKDVTGRERHPAAEEEGATAPKVSGQTGESAGGAPSATPTTTSAIPAATGTVTTTTTSATQTVTSAVDTVTTAVPPAPALPVSPPPLPPPPSVPLPPPPAPPALPPLP
jgi:RNA polymerase sigma factor (sigma-70 family)